MKVPNRPEKSQLASLATVLFSMLSLQLSAQTDSATFTPGPQQEAAAPIWIAFMLIATTVTVLLLAGIGLWLIGMAFENEGFLAKGKKLTYASLFAGVAITVWGIVMSRG